MFINQLVPKSRSILVNRFALLKKRFLHTRGVISLTRCHKFNTNRSYPYQHSQFITLLPKFYCSSSPTTTTTTSTTLKVERDGKTDDHEILINDDTLDELFKEMDQRIGDVNQFLQTNERNNRFQTFGLMLITMVAGVFAGAYTAHFGAWFLDKVGLFIFEDEDDD